MLSFDFHLENIMAFPARSFLTLWLIAASSVAHAWTQDGEAAVFFDAKGPAGFKIRGEAKGLNEQKQPKVTVADDGTSFKVTVRLEDVDTDNSLRNKHMLEDMQAQEFPLVTLTVPTSSLQESGSTAKGTFEIHGQKKEVPFKYTAKCQAQTCDVEGSANLNLSEFGIKIRSYLGITVKPDIVVSAKFKVKK